LPGFLPNQKFWGCTYTPASYTSEHNLVSVVFSIAAAIGSVTIFLYIKVSSERRKQINTFPSKKTFGCDFFKPLLLQKNIVNRKA